MNEVHVNYGNESSDVPRKEQCLHVKIVYHASNWAGFLIDCFAKRARCRITESYRRATPGAFAN